MPFQRLSVIVMVLLLAGATTGAAQSRPWLVRARGIAVLPNASSDPSGLDVKADATAEVDITRLLNRFLSVELVLATAAQEVKAGATSLGTVTHLPPTLLLQGRPFEGRVSPYLGAGVNLTAFYAKSGGLENLDLSTSVGWALQAGFDVRLAERTVLNFDGKYVHLTTDVKSGGTKLYDLKVNPFVIGAGLGYRF